jgi:hypothetical protein
MGVIALYARSPHEKVRCAEVLAAGEKESKTKEVFFR